MEKKIILIADDDVDYLFQMQRKIESFGYEVFSCQSQADTEALLETLRPDLAIFDLMMENNDSGFILSYKLKKKHPEVPVIIATAVSAEAGISFGISSREDQQWIKADLYLEKGIRGDQLQKEIKSLIKD